MKMQEATDIINNKPKGYMISFEWCGDGMLRSDHFPDKNSGENLIQTEWDAWELACRFAKITKGETCNLYVIDDTFTPVNDYEKRKILNR